jgi:phosphoglycerate dehydrogenase-like enzyme
MFEEVLKVGLIGLGNMGRNHLRVMRTLPWQLVLAKRTAYPGWLTQPRCSQTSTRW